MMKRALIASLCAVLCFVAWAQAPETVGTDYTRPPIHYSDGTKSFVNSDVFFRLLSADKETGLNFVEFALNGGSFMKYRSPFQILEEGPYDISYRGYDNSGNYEVPKTLSVIVDNTPPQTAIQTTEPLYNDGTTTYCSAETKWYVSASDKLGEAGVAAGYMGTDLNALNMYGKGKEAEDAYFSLTEQGPAYLYYTSIDNVGNLAPIALAAVTVDTDPPVVRLENSNRLINKENQYMVFPNEELVDDEGRVIVSANESVAFAATDELSGVDAIYIKINDDEYTKYVEPITFSQNDVYTIEVKAIDNVGNVSEPVVFTCYVDKINPASEIEFIDRAENVLETVTAE